LQFTNKKGQKRPFLLARFDIDGLNLIEFNHKDMAEKNNQNNNAVSDYQDLADLMVGQFEKVFEKFEKIDEKFEKIDEKFEKIDEKFEKIDIRFEKIEQLLDTKADKADIDRILTRVALLGNKVDDYRAEQIGMQKQLDKHEKWHNQTATKIGFKLRPE